MEARGERKPDMVLRLGVTGSRLVNTSSDSIEHTLPSSIQDVIRKLVINLKTARDDSRTSHCYNGDVTPILRCISPLAEGADQQVASIVLDQRAFARSQGVEICLEVVIPFNATAYKATFDPELAKAAGANFDRLAEEARCGFLELDGSAKNEIDRPKSYEAAGQTVVRNADLLIALWDDAVVAKGHGGTRDIVHFALKTGVPVWWIDPNGRRPPRFVDDELEFWGQAVPDAATDRLDRFLKAVLFPPDVPVADTRQNLLTDYMAEPLRLNRNCWLIHAGTIGAVKRLAVRAPRVATVDKPPATVSNRQRHLWDVLTRPLGRRAFQPNRIAAQLSAAYQHKYRTSYFVVLMAAAFALGVAVFGLSGLVNEEAGSVLELVFLLFAASLVLRSGRGRWHEKYIAYRLLSELARPGPLLNALGWSLPFAHMRRAAGYEGQSWTGWLAAAHDRAAPLASGVLRQELNESRDRIISQLIDPQLKFHKKRVAECEGGSQWLGRLGLVTFVLTIALVVLKLFIELEYAHEFLTYALRQFDIERAVNILSAMAAAMPAFSAIFFGLKAYEELEPLAELSKQIISEFETIRVRILSIDLLLPLSSQILAEELLGAAFLMLSEVGGWAELFRSRAVEA